MSTRIFPKKCSVCLSEYTQEQWLELEYIGDQDDPPVVLEMRNCPCGGTLVVYRASDGTYIEKHPEDE